MESPWWNCAPTFGEESSHPGPAIPPTAPLPLRLKEAWLWLGLFEKANYTRKDSIGGLLLQINDAGLIHTPIGLN